MAALPKPRRDPDAGGVLVPFQPRWAAQVASWATDPQEAYWLAPKTPPPVTADSVLRWRTVGHEPFALLPPGATLPAAYGELNRLGDLRRQYWIGHVIVDPARRGRGHGVRLTRLLLQEAFEQRGAERVTLVVFPENQAALACYRAAGFHDDGEEWHEFAAYGVRVRLLRLARRRF
jgi:RimJ/RimL family protein N-acetyltransferase